MTEHLNIQEIDESPTGELLQPLSRPRQIFTYTMNGLVFGLTALALIPLLSILWEIMVKGLKDFQLEMLVKPVIENGFANAIIGTILMVGLGALISVPVGLMTGIFLAEFGKTNPIAQFVRFITSILTGVPSIVVGMFAYGIIVLTTKGFTAIAGGFALAVIMLPVIILTTEEALKLIPTPQRLASAALGGTRLQTTFRVVVSSALPGIATGILLAIARAAGETAPLVFTALFSFDWSSSLFNTEAFSQCLTQGQCPQLPVDENPLIGWLKVWLPGFVEPTASLPVLIFNLYNDPEPAKNQLVWTTSIILLSLVLCFSLLSRLVTNKSRIK
ncbi:MAG TPA: phosphate ABC transporter permease PstA [Nostocaceae cyanobacterium]|nr:phosphate ABC transporter permease PstA [Nostocaceae cyanobacterium]